MKLMNFHHINPKHIGKGLASTSNLDREVFEEFHANIPLLTKIAHTIISFSKSGNYTNHNDLDVHYEAKEGKLLTRYHQVRERDQKIIERKKSHILKKAGKLLCEGCAFDFQKMYGKHGEGFIECHHTKPISEINFGESTTLNDLALLCSNCHRMIHRRRPWLTLTELQNIICHNKLNKTPST